MVKEAYVSFEVAKLLKEKGFDWECRTVYKSNSCIHDNVRCEGKWLINSSLFPFEYSAPTHQMAMKWLREVYGIHVSAIPCTNPQHIIVWQQNIINLNPIREGGMFLQLEPNKKCYNSYEGAVEAALKYCIENLV